MPYKNIKNLPRPVIRNLPRQAEKIYMKVFNNAWKEYKNPKKRKGRASREETARRVAWAAVKKRYKKDKKSGRWARIKKT